MLKNNDFKMKIILASLAFCMVLTLSVALSSPAMVNANQTPANAAAGSADDPLITLSYLNSVLSSSANSSNAYEVLELKKGQRLGAKSSSLEIILRSGYATVISQYSNQGIADLTWGEELLNGENLPINHSLLIPRADGRGVLINSAIAYIMVRGDYEIY